VSAASRTASFSSAEVLFSVPFCQPPVLGSPSPEYHPAYHELGLLAVDKGQLPYATQLVSQAIALNDGVYGYHRNLCELYRRLGSLEKAVASGQRATTLKEDDIDAHSWS